MSILNDAYSLLGEIHRELTVRTLECLRDGDSTFDADAIFSWALLNGWSERAAVSLREYGLGIPWRRRYLGSRDGVTIELARELTAKWRRVGAVMP